MDRAATREGRAREHNFSLQFERDQEEEEGHQSVVNPLLQRTNDHTRTELNADVRLPQSEECISPPRVRQEQSHHRRHQQDAARSRLDPQEP